MPDECADVRRPRPRDGRALGLHDVASDALNTLACVEYEHSDRWYPWICARLSTIALDARAATIQAGRAYANLQAHARSTHMRYAEAERFYREGIAYCDEHDLATCGLCLAGGQASVLLHTGRWADGRGDRRRAR